MSVVACIYLMVAMSKLPDQNSAKLFILKMGLTFKFPLLCFGLGVICLSPLGCATIDLRMHTCTCTYAHGTTCTPHVHVRSYIQCASTYTSIRHI